MSATARCATLLILLAGSAMTGCKTRDDAPGRPFTAVERPARAQPCPLLAAEDEPSFDARRLLGRGEREARAEAARFGCRLRVTERDGRQLPATDDLVHTRIDVKLRDGIVVALAESGWTAYAPLEGP